MRTSPPTLGPKAPLVLLSGVVLQFVGACKSPEEYREDADREVYEIVKARRDELRATGAFTIDRPPNTLRERLLNGEVRLEPLDLVECLDVAAENSREYQTQREDLYLSALDLTLERWNYSVQTTGTFGAFLNGTSFRDASAGGGGTFGFSKLFASGLSIIGDIGLDAVRNISLSEGWGSVSRAALSITQPLLRGFGRDVVLEPLTQAERDVLYQARDYERFRRSFTVDVASRYFRILEASATLVNEEKNHENLLVLQDFNEAMAQAGRTDDIQVGQAKQNVLRAENSVIRARQALQRLIDDFKLFMGIPVEAPLEIEAGDFTQLETWEELLGVDVSEQAAIETALSQRLDLKTAVDEVVDAERKAYIAADDLRTILDFHADGAIRSEQNTPLIFKGDQFVWNVSLDLDLPINNLPERNSYRASLITLERSKRSAEELGDEIVGDIRDDLRSLIAARESYEIQVGAEELARRRVEGSSLSLRAGRADTRDVLESQESLVQAQNETAAALTTYILSGLSLYQDMELLRVSEEGISVDTAPLQERLEAQTP